MGISKIKPLTSQYHSVGGSRGRGLLCLAPQLVFDLQLALHYDIPTYTVKNSDKTVIKSWVYFVTYHEHLDVTKRII